MIFTAENILLIGSILLFVSILVGKTGHRLGIPTLLLFLVVGMVFGSDGLGLQFHNVKEAQFIGMVALSIILFSGGMNTRFKDIQPVWKPGIVLSTVGVLLTTCFTGVFIWWLSNFNELNIHFSLTTSLLLAATMSSTDSASVFAILRSQKINLKENLGPLLELESGSNDPMAYLLTILLLQLIQSDGTSVISVNVIFLLKQFAVGTIAGFLLGKLATLMLNRLHIHNQALYPILLLAFVFFTFSLTDLLNGNGYLAVYLAGMMVGNQRIACQKEIYTFMDGLTWLFQIIMFLCLGLLVNPHEMLSMAPIALLIGLFLILAGRPLSVFISLLPFRHIPFKARLFVSWVGLRGAVPIIFATYPVVEKVENSSHLFNIVFFITILSLIVQGTSVTRAAHLLHLSEPLIKSDPPFGIEWPDEIDSTLSHMTVTAQTLTKGNTLKEMNLPQGTLVMMIKRGNDYLVPNGTLELQEGDKLLLISENPVQPSD